MSGGGSATSVIFLCTGNATRSVLAGAALSARRPDLVVSTAGTLSVDGLPMSTRTRAAFEAVGLAVPRHASRQASPDDLGRHDLIVGLAPEHVAWVRREHAELAGRTATLARLTRDLPAEPHGRPSLAHRLGALGLAGVALEAWEEVVDPGGGEVDAYIACAREIVTLVDVLAPRL